MGNQIISKPDAIRAAGNNIASINVKASYSEFPEELSSEGLVAESLNEIIRELETIETLMIKIVEKFPEKLEKVAVIFEEADREISNLFKQGGSNYTAGGGGYSVGGGGNGANGGGGGGSR